MFVVLIPIAAVILIENYASLDVSSGTPMGFILYFLAPLASFEYSKDDIISVYPPTGLMMAFFLAVIMIIVYSYLFQHQEFKP